MANKEKSAQTADKNREIIQVSQYITADPAVCHGKPCFKDTRIMVYLVLGLLEAGLTPETIIGPDYYPQLTKDHIKAALHYAAQLLKTRSYVASNTL